MGVVRVPTVLLATALLVAACGGGDDSATTGVASASDLADTAESTEEVVTDEVIATDADATGDVTAEEAALAFSQCMRDNGFADFPDPEIGANGQPNLRAAIIDSGIDFQDPDFQTFGAECRDEVGADNFGAGGGQGGNARAAIEENLLVYTQCLRDEGLDVGDIDFGGGPGAGGQGPGNGGNGNGGGGNGGGGNGQAQGNGGAGFNPGTRIAQALDLDPEDPAVIAAQAACEQVLEEAFAGIGGGGPQGGAPAAANDA